MPDHCQSESMNWWESAHSDSSSELDFDREVWAPMLLTTAQERTRLRFFGETNTQYTQTCITHSVLYVALYSIREAPSEVDDYHWAFIVGPSHEEADSKGTLYSMEPRRHPGYNRPYGGAWNWLYHQPTVPLRGQCDLLARLMIAEVADMELLQAIVLSWSPNTNMYEHADWMSIRWVKNILKSLDEEEEVCLGRKMESFESVEAEGRWLAETEEEKRKGFCLLDSRVSTRTLFERESATALLSTATVDIAIKYPVLYVAIYKNGRSPCAIDEYRWAFLIGPSNEIAESEGVRCCVDLRLDSNGLPTWDYNQIIVPLRGEDDLLARMLVAEIVNLGPLGEILRDQHVNLMTERTDSIAGDSDWRSVEWVRERLEMLERKPECLAHKCHDFSMFERVGRQLAEELNQQRREMVTAFGVEVRTLCLVHGWEKPEDDETEIAVKLDLARGKPNTISRAVQIITGVVGEAALGMRRRIAEREKRKLANKQKREANARSERSANATVLAAWRKLQGMDEAKKTVEYLGGKDATARPEGGQISAVNVAKLNKAETEPERKKVAKEDETDEDESEDDEEDDGEAEGEAEDDEDQDEEDDDDEDDDEAEDDEDQDEEEDDDEEDDDDEVEGEAKPVAEKNVGRKRANARPEDVQITTSQFSMPKKPDKATGERNVAKENKADGDEIETEIETETEDENEEPGEDADECSDEDEEEPGEDADESSDEDEEEQKEDDEGESSDDEDDEEGHQRHDGAHTAEGNISKITLSR